MTSPIRLLLADDQALVRGALAALLALEPDLEVVAEVGRGDEVVAEARRARPDVALLDVEMPGLDGISATRDLRVALPSCRVLVVTTFGRPVTCAGPWPPGPAVSWSRTRRPPSWPTRSAGWPPGCGWSIPAWPRRPSPPGTARSRPGRPTCCARPATGTVADIAAALHLSEGTVRNHLSAAIGKTGARTRAEAVRLASANGWLLGS